MNLALMTDPIVSHGFGHHLYQKVIRGKSFLDFLRADHPAAALWRGSRRWKLWWDLFLFLLVIDNLAIKILLELLVIRTHVFNGFDMFFQFRIGLSAFLTGTELFNKFFIHQEIKWLKRFWRIQISTRGRSDCRFGWLSSLESLEGQSIFWVGA